LRNRAKANGWSIALVTIVSDKAAHHETIIAWTNPLLSNNVLSQEIIGHDQPDSMTVNVKIEPRDGEIMVWVNQPVLFRQVHDIDIVIDGAYPHDCATTFNDMPIRYRKRNPCLILYRQTYKKAASSSLFAS